MKNVNGKLSNYVPDPYISSVLNSIFHISQIDPEWIQPDFRFDKELEMTQEQVIAIGKFALKELGHPIPGSSITTLSHAKTPRELVDMIKKMIDETVTKVA